MSQGMKAAVLALGLAACATAGRSLPAPAAPADATIESATLGFVCGSAEEITFHVLGDHVWGPILDVQLGAAAATGIMDAEPVQIQFDEDDAWGRGPLGELTLHSSFNGAERYTSGIYANWRSYFSMHTRDREGLRYCGEVAIRSSAALRERMASDYRLSTVIFLALEQVLNTRFRASPAIYGAPFRWAVPSTSPQ